VVAHWEEVVAVVAVKLRGDEVAVDDGDGVAEMEVGMAEKADAAAVVISKE